MMQRAEAEVAREREQAMITFRQQVVNLALGATPKVIGDSLDETRQRRLIDDFISDSTVAAATTATNGSGSVAATAGGTNGIGGGIAPPVDR